MRPEPPQTIPYQITTTRRAEGPPALAGLERARQALTERLEKAMALADTATNDRERHYCRGRWDEADMALRAFNNATRAL